MNFHFSHFVQSFWVFSVKTPGVKAAVVKQRLTVGSGTRDMESPRNTNQLSISSLFSVCSFPRQTYGAPWARATKNVKKPPESNV